MATVSFSLVVPLHAVERYVPDFLDSLDRQTAGDYRVEVVFVDDGSPDASADLVAGWIARRSGAGVLEARLIRQENRGVSAARNRGLEEARGDWITFPDPDDVLEPGYLGAVADFVAGHDEPLACAATYIVRLDDRAGGAVVDNHALRHRFDAGSRVVDIDADPDVFQLNVATAFFPRAQLLRSGVRFRETLHASEDALFVAAYLLTLSSRRVALVREARYRYRKRAAADSAVDRYPAEPDSYTVRFADGYLPLLVEAATDVHGVPGWLQSTVLYEYKWLFDAQSDPARYATVLTEDERTAVLGITSRIVEHLDPERILAFGAAYLSLEVRLLLLALRDTPLPGWQTAFADKTDAVGGWKRVRYFVRAADATSAGGDATLRYPDYFGQRALAEVISWVPPAQSSIEIAGRMVPIAAVPRSHSLDSARDEDRSRAMGQVTTPSLSGLWSRARRGAVSKVALIRLVARVPLVTRRYRGAWLFEGPLDDTLRHAARAHTGAGGRAILVGNDDGWRAGDGERVRTGSPAHQIAMLSASRLVSAQAAPAGAIRPSLFRGRRRIRVVWVGDRLPSGAKRVALDRADVDRLVILGDALDAVAGLDRTVYGAREVRTGPPDLAFVEAAIGDAQSTRSGAGEDTPGASLDARELLVRARSITQAPGALSPEAAAEALDAVVAAFLREQSVATRFAFGDGEAPAEVLDEAAAVLRRIPRESIVAYRARRVPLALRMLLLTLRGDELPDHYAHTTTRGPIRLSEVRYLSVGRAHREVFRLDGVDVQPVSAKWRRIDYFGQDAVSERIAWLPGGGRVSVEIDGVPAIVGRDVYPFGIPAAAPRRRSLVRRALGRARRSARRALSVRSRFSGCWLLMDRVGHAGDNAEGLFHHLRADRPDIDAWFVLAKGSRDYDRLAPTGRVIAYGSAAHRRALRAAAVVASSYLDREMIDPLPRGAYPTGSRPWRFVYLEHGVLHQDLSAWFNTKPIDLMTTATPAEWRAVVGDGTPYVLTAATTKLTGFPRFDRLVARTAGSGAEDLVVLAPTWRLSLAEDKTADYRRGLRDRFEDTRFAREWFGLARDAALAEAAHAAGCEVVFLPHPSMRGLIDDLPSAAGIRFAGDDVETDDILARARVLVTDYSSIAFDASLAGSAIVYFPFDHDDMAGGHHTYLPTPVDDERDGLGPVGVTRAEVIAHIDRILRIGASPVHARRRDEIAVLADGHAAARITHEIEELIRR